MKRYIDKDTLVAEIKTRIETYNKGYANGDDCRADALETFLHDIDFLEVKEMDLTDRKTDWQSYFRPYTGKPGWGEEDSYNYKLISSTINRDQDLSLKTKDKLTSWLKSIKERIGG